MGIEVTVMSLDFDSDEAPRTTDFDKDELTFGRLPSNDIVLDRPEISAEHAKLRLDRNENGDAGTLYITDLGSSNGTMVENTSLEAYREFALAPNERVIIGAYLIKLALLQGEELAAEDTPESPAEEVEDQTEEEEEEQVIEETLAEEQESAQAAESSAPAADQQAVYSGRIDRASVMNLDFVATRVFTLSGEVNHHDDGLEGVEIDAGPLGRTITDSEGKFSFSDIAEDTKFALSAAKDNFKFEGNSIGTIQNDDVSVTLTATELLTICGTITYRGEPLTDVEIDGGALGKCRSGSDGSYCFNDVPEDTEFTLTAYKDGFKLSFSGTAGQ